MASPDSSGRILRIEDTDSAAQDADSTAQEAKATARVDQPRQLITVSKPCVVPECTGTMDFPEPLGAYWIVSNGP